MKKDVSIILPSIRPQFLETFYASALDACKNHSFEIVIPTPFDVPDEIKRRDNVKVIKTHAAPTVAKQMAIQLCNSEFLYNITDDGFIMPDSIDKALELHKTALGEKDILNMIYAEGVLDPVTLQPLREIYPYPDHYWHSWNCPGLRIPGVNQNWKICMHFFMKLDYFYELGGFDCRWEYSVHAIYDLMFRVQAAGGKIIETPFIASAFTHYPGHSYDHGPIHDAQLGPDTVLFNEIYTNENAAIERKVIDYNNWKTQPDVWARRFKSDIIPITRTEYDETLK